MSPHNAQRCNFSVFSPVDSIFTVPLSLYHSCHSFLQRTKATIWLVSVLELPFTNTPSPGQVKMEGRKKVRPTIITTTTDSPIATTTTTSSPKCGRRKTRGKKGKRATSDILICHRCSGHHHLLNIDQFFLHIIIPIPPRKQHPL